MTNSKWTTLKTFLLTQLYWQSKDEQLPLFKGQHTAYWKFKCLKCCHQMKGWNVVLQWKSGLNFVRVLQYQWQLWCLGTISSKSDRKMKIPLKPRKLWESWTEISGMTSFNRSNNPKIINFPQKNLLFFKMSSQWVNIKTIENLLQCLKSTKHHPLSPKSIFSMILKRSKIDKPVRILDVGRR